MVTDAGRAALVQINERFGGNAARRHGQVRPLSVNAIDEVPRVPDDDPSLPVKLRDGSVAAFRDQVRRVLLHLGSLEKRPDARVGLELLEERHTA